MSVCEGWLAEYTYIAGVTVDDGLALEGSVLAVSSVAGHCDRYVGWGGLSWVVKGVVMVVLLIWNEVRIYGQLAFLYSSRSWCCSQSAWWGDDVESVIVDRTADHSHFFGGALQPPAGT